jgi:hypothetical protein
MKVSFLMILMTMMTQAFTQEVSELSKSIVTPDTASSSLEEEEKKKDSETMLQEQKEATVLDYSSISKVIKSDGLEVHQKNKAEEVKSILTHKEKINIAKFDYPRDEDFWSFMSEYWLVKNAQSLQWDFTKPAYGIEDAYKGLLEKFGYYKKRFKILIVNTPDITHMGLPSDKDEYILLVSLPFMRTLDLTKVDISILLLEDFFRIEAKNFQQNIKTDLKALGTNFQSSKIDPKLMPELLKEYTRIVYKNGFTFQQQYEVTKSMDRVLKSDPVLWSSYIKLLNKIDRLVKSNLLYKDYNNIYPSPELQIKWLTPKKKDI